MADSRPHAKAFGFMLGFIWLTINGTRIAYLLYERQPVSLTDEEQQVYDLVFVKQHQVWVLNGPAK